MATTDQWDRIRRRIGEIAFRHLSQRQVAIVGLGSGGGIVALELAKAGVTHFTLIDPDVIEEHNVVRHACGLRHVGEAKVAAVRSEILDRNPCAQVATIQADVTTVFDRLNPVDLVIVAVDSETAKHQINTFLRHEAHVPALYAGVYEQAKGGDVWLVEADGGPCYACLASLFTPPAPEEEPKFDYGLVDPFGVLKGEPGLGVDVAHVALMQARWALRILLRGTDSTLGEMPGNVVIMAMSHRLPAGEINGHPVHLPLGGAIWYNVAQLSACQICHPQDGMADLTFDDLL